MSYSQHDEEEVILEYFGDFKGTLIDIGCNDGITLSNSARLIELGWSGKLFDADPNPYKLALERYKDNPLVEVFNYGIAKEIGDSVFYKCQDSLISSTDPQQAKIWNHLTFIESTCKMIKYNNKWEADFITIDAEHMDWEILQTIDLTNVKCLCIEFGRKKDAIINYCVAYGMKLTHQTDENLIFIR